MSPEMTDFHFIPAAAAAGTLRGLGVGKGGVVLKRIWWLALVLLLAGCGGEKGEMSGRVQGARVEDGNLVYIGLHDYETGEDTRFYLTEDTDVISWTDDPDEAGFLGGDVSETRVNVEYSVRSGV